MANMTEAARKEQREYMREWRAKNKDRVRANNQRYWEKRAAARRKEISKDVQDN